MNRDHHVIGNGESRKDLNVDNLNGTTYGCNAIYRDYYTDYLFNKDKPIQHEILDSECWKDRKVIVQTKWFGQGHYNEAYSTILLWKDILGTNEFTDCGSAVLTFATNRAKSYGGEVNMYGFDFDKADGPINNIYKDTPNYSNRLNQRKGVTSEFLEVLARNPEINYVYHGDELPTLLEVYTNVRYQS